MKNQGSVYQIQKGKKLAKQTHTEKHLIQTPNGFANFLGKYFNKSI